MVEASNSPALETLPHLVVIGAGFGGLAAVRALAKAPVLITLIDRSNHHLFQPLLYQVATAGLSAPAIAAPIRHILARQRNVTVLMADVTDIDIAARVVRFGADESAASRTVDYDHLIVASGAGHSYFGRDEWATIAPGLKTLSDAFEIRHRVLVAYERAEREDDPALRAAWLSFVVVGGGPTGVELAGTLAEIARHTLHGEFRRIDTRDARVMLVEGGARILPTFDAALSAKANHQLERLGVEVRTGCLVTAIVRSGVQVKTSDGEEFLAARTVLWAAGVAASPLGKQLGIATDRAGHVPVAPDLSVPGHPEISVVGDLAVFAQDGHEIPGIAPAAKQMGRHAARNLLARLAQQPTRPFRYRDYGALATIGRGSAIAQLGGMRLSGFPAWLFWLFVHIFFLIGFRNRLLVLIEWAWSYFTFERNARIVSDTEGPDAHGVRELL